MWKNIPEIGPEKPWIVGVTISWELPYGAMHPAHWERGALSSFEDFCGFFVSNIYPLVI